MKNLKVKMNKIRLLHIHICIKFYSAYIKKNVTVRLKTTHNIKQNEKKLVLKV
jgi:hypothetical protein